MDFEHAESDKNIMTRYHGSCDQMSTSQRCVRIKGEIERSGLRGDAMTSVFLGKGKDGAFG